MACDAVAVAIFLGTWLGPQLAVLVFAGYETWYPFLIRTAGLIKRSGPASTGQADAEKAGVTKGLARPLLKS